MIGLAVAGLLAFVILLLVRHTRLSRTQAAVSSAAPGPGGPGFSPAAGIAIEVPSAMRLLGLLLLVVMLLLLAWLYIPLPIQLVLMTGLIYPAAFAVALVLLVDRASRSWSPKGPGQGYREWLFCDGLTVLLVLGYLNVLQLEVGAEGRYNVFFWDMLHITLFFFVFWMLDRKSTRLRFLVTYGYLIVLPVLWLVWQAVLAVPVPEAAGDVVATVSWWSTRWPFFFWAIIGFAAEIVNLVLSSEGDSQAFGIIKDTVFIVAYAVLLIVAIP